MFALRIFVWLALGVAAVAATEWYEASPVAEQRRDLYLRQLDDRDDVPQEIRRDYLTRMVMYPAAGGCWVLLGILFFTPEIARAFGPRPSDIRI